MKRSEAVKVIARLVAIWPRPTITEATINEYVESMIDLSVAQAMLALETLRVSATFLPSIAEFRRAATKSSVDGLIPDADSAWQEVRTQLSRIGSKRGMINFATDQTWAPVWSHPLVGRIADAMGWDALCRSETEMADRAHFLRLYEPAAVNARSEQAMTPAGKALMAHLIGSVPQLEEQP